jgi:hypothetical protein
MSIENYATGSKIFPMKNIVYNVHNFRKTSLFYSLKSQRTIRTMNKVAKKRGYLFGHPLFFELINRINDIFSFHGY